MFKKIILSFFVILFSCNKEISNNKKTSNAYINFDLYSFNTVKGTKEKITLKEEKKYLLDFWYLECAPCVKQHKLIKEYQDKLIENNIEVIGFSIDRNKESWKNYLKKHQYNWKNYNQFYAENDLKYDLDIKLFPTYFLVDDKGNIEKKFNSFLKVITHLKIE